MFSILIFFFLIIIIIIIIINRWNYAADVVHKRKYLAPLPSRVVRFCALSEHAKVIL